MAQNPRKIAVNILMDIEKNSAYTNIEMNKIRAQANLSDVDNRFIGELVNGVQRRKFSLDYIISLRSSVKLNKISPFVLSVLRTGVYQILYMDKVPVSAAVNECVKLIKNSSVARLSGYVNAVLRAVDGTELSSLDKTSVYGLSIIYSIPEWIVSRWIDIFGLDFATALLASISSNHPLCIRRNPNLDAHSFSQKLLGEGVSIKPFKLNGFDDYDFCYSVQSSDKPLTSTLSFKEGDFYIQDPAASFASFLLEPIDGETVIDMCAAPGGKSIFLAELMHNNGTIYAFDIYDHKIGLISDNCRRHNITIIKPLIQDATTFNDKYINVADKIICDVPCSGFGLMRKKPDIRYSRTKEDIYELASVSQKILDNAARYLKDGGILVFSTCTIEPLENEKTIEKFLSEHKEFSLYPFGDKMQYKTFYPCVDDTDGFFVCRLKKNGVTK